MILVGAHRSGKTSVMNMVLDILDRKTPDYKDEHELEPGFPKLGEKIIGMVAPAVLTLLPLKPPIKFGLVASGSRRRARILFARISTARLLVLPRKLLETMLLPVRDQPLKLLAACQVPTPEASVVST